MPKALAEAKIISKKDASTAEARSLLPGAAIQFGLAWGELLVTQERFQIGTTEAPYIRVCDFAIKALKEIDSPVKKLTALGINVESHFDVGTAKARDAIGRRLAPPGAWGQWGAEIAESMEEPGPLHGGMVVLQMRQPFREGGVGGHLDIVAGASTKIVDSGVYFRSNHHHVLLDAPRKNGGKKGAKAERDQFELLEHLAERFDASVQTAENIFNSVLDARSA